MKSSIKIIIALLLFVFSQNLSVFSQNLLTNGGFEDGIGSWLFLNTNGSVATAEVVQDQVHNGSNALKVLVSQLGTGISDIQLEYSGIPVQKDLVYMLTFFARADSNGYLSMAQITGIPPNSNLFYDSTNLYFTTNWKKYEVIFPAPANVTGEINFSILFGKTLGTIYLDDFSFEKKSNSWYEGAEFRIDKYRKGNFIIKVEDAGSNPVSDSIIIKHKKHEFPWGTAIDLTDKSTGNTYTAAQAITAPADSEIYRVERFAPYLAYLLPSEIGTTYNLTIKLSENYLNAANLRFYDVYINGALAMKDVDNFALAKGKYKAFDTIITVLAADTIIKLEFYASKDNAAVVGLVLSDSATGDVKLRLNCGGPAITTKSGNTYLNDLPYVDKNATNTGTTNDDWIKSLMLKYCNYGVCGNQFKWSGIEPNQGVINYAPFDNTLGWFQKVGWDMRAHTLHWGGTSSTDYHELPQWVGALPPAVMYDTCKMRTDRELTRYKGIVKEYDIMNEPLHATYLQSKVGDSINWNCFKWAHDADPDARLFINDYNVVEYQNDCNNYTNLISKLLSKGAPITGIGSQCHFDYTIDIPNVKARFDQLAQFGLPIKITEFDMKATDATQLTQAIETSRIMRLAFSHPAIEGFVFWGLTDPSWRPGVGTVNLIQADKTPKIAADSVYHLIHEYWSTKIEDKTDTAGTYMYRGFYGDYEVLAKFGATWKKFDISNLRSEETNVVLLKEQDASITSPVLKKVRIVAPTGIELTFDKDMSDPVIEFKNFKVFDTLNNTVQSAILKVGDPTTIVLAMKSPIKPGRYIPVSYFPGNQTSADGGLLEAFGPVLDETLTPAYLYSSTTPDGKAIAIAFRKEIEETSVQLANFNLKVNNVSRSLTDANINPSKDTLYLTLASQILSGSDVINITYQSGSLSTTDSLTVTSFFSKTVENKIIVPKFSSAATTKDGATIQIRFSQSIADPASEISSFSVNVNGVINPVTQAELLSTSDKYVVLTLTSVIFAGDVVTVAYDPGSLASPDGIPVPAFASNVTNKVITGLNCCAGENEIQLYPNPITDQLFISNINGYQSVVISNLLGQEILILPIPVGERMEINTTVLKSGVYLLTLKNGNNKQVFKILKR